MRFRPQPLLASTTALLAVLGSAHAAFAGECSIDDDCGQGFECQVSTSGSGGAPAAGGASGSGASAGGSAVGGSAGSSATGGAAGGAFVPPREATCGDGLCQSPETATTCVIDCTNSMCVLAECDTDADCAEGYACEDESLPGTGGASGGPSGCGDGLCSGGETQATCPVDCTATRRCTPAGGLCSSDANCAPGFYCSFMGSGAGGGSASGSTGAGGFAGTLATGGASSGGTAGTSGSAAGGMTGGTGSGDAALAAGTCMPREDGSGGTTGSGGSIGSGGVGTGGVGTGGTGIAGSGGAGTSGTGTGGTGAFGSGGVGAMGGSAGNDGGTTGGGAGGAGGGGGSGGSTNTGGTGTGAGGTGGDQDPDSVERGGCSVAAPHARSPLAELGALLLVGLGVARRRRR